MTPFQAYCQPAMARRAWWRVIVGTVLIVAFWIAGTLVVLAGYAIWLIADLGDPDRALAQLPQLIQGGTPERVAIMLVSFCGIWAGVLIVMGGLHGQSLGSLFAPDRRRRPGGFGAGVVLAVLFILPSVGLSAALAPPERTDVALGPWALWLVPLGALVFVQAIAEELIFRGYMQQQMGALARHWLVWGAIPSLLFGMLHFANAGELGAALLYMAVTTAIGGVLAVLVWRTGSLWTAAGAHWGNNAVAILVIGPEGPLTAMALWTFPPERLMTMMAIHLGVVGLVLAVLLSPAGRVFGDGRSRIDGP